MKRLDTLSVQTGLDAISSQNSKRNIIFDGTYYFVCHIPPSIPTPSDTVYIYRYNSNWTNKTEVFSGTTHTGTLTDSVIRAQSGCYTNGVYDFCFITRTVESGTSYNTLVNIRSVTAGAGAGTWTQGNKYRFSYNPATDVSYIMCQNLSLNATIYYVISDNSLYISVISDSGTKYTDISGFHSSATSDYNYIYFYRYFGTSDNRVRRWSLDGGFEDDMVVSGVSMNPFNSWFDHDIYYQTPSKKLRILFHNGYLYYYTASTGVWKITTIASDKRYNGFVWLDYLNRRYLLNVLYRDTMLILFDGDILSFKISTSANWGCGISPSIGINTNATQYNIVPVTTTDYYQLQTKHFIEATPQTVGIKKTDVSDNEGVILYTDTDKIITVGKYDVVQDDYNTVQYDFSIISLLEEELNKIIDYTSTAPETIADALANIVNFDYKLQLYASISVSGSATLYTFSFKGKMLRDVLTEIARIDGRIWYIKDGFFIQVDNGTTDSSVNISNGYTIPIKSVLKRTIGTIELWGKNGAYYKKSNNIGKTYYSDIYLDKDQAELEAYGNNLLTVNSATVIQYELSELQAISLFNVGEQVTYELNIQPYNITSALFYTKELWYDGYTDSIMKLILQDALHFPKREISVKQVHGELVKLESETTKLKTTADAALPTAGGRLTGNIDFDTSLNYKGHYTLDFGSTGALEGTIIGTPDTEEVVTEDGHTECYHVVDNDSASCGRDWSVGATLTSGYASTWIKTQGTGSTYFVLYDGTNNPVIIWINGLALNYYDFGASGYVSITTLTADVWYHIFLDWTKNATLRVYLNGTQMIYDANAVGNYNVTTIRTYINSSNGDAHFDAIYCGASYLAAWSSLYAGSICSPQTFTASGERNRWHMFDLRNTTTSLHWTGISSTNADTVILDLFTGADESPAAGISSITDNLSEVKLPPNATKVWLEVEAVADTANTTNGFECTRNFGGSENWRCGLRQKAGAVANFPNSLQGPVDLDSNGKVKIRFRRGAGAVTINVHVRGYYI